MATMNEEAHAAHAAPFESPSRQLLSPYGTTTTTSQKDESAVRNDDALDLGPAALGDPDDEEIADLESNIMQRSRTMEDFARIISEWRTDRERAAAAGPASNGRPMSVYGAGAQAGEGSSSQGHLRIRRSIASLSAEAARSNALDVIDDGASQYSYEASSVGDPDEVNAARVSPTFSPAGLEDGGGAGAVRIRCTCCCGRGTRRCKRARKATREWSQVESDLRLAAQIGQALLRRSDALQSELTSKQDEHGARINSLMKKLSMSIKEAGQLSKRLEQSELNLEACEASNRALVRELDEARQDVSKAKISTARTSGLESRLKRAEQEADDLRQESEAKRKHGEQLRSKLKRAEKVNEGLASDLKLARLMSKKNVMTEEERLLRKEEVRKLVEERIGASASNLSERKLGSDDQGRWAETIMTENDSLIQQNKELREILEGRNEELTQLRDELSQRHERAPTVTTSDLPHAGDSSHSRTLRLSDLQDGPATALGNELVDMEGILPSSQPAPGYLSPNAANVSLPSASPASISSSTGTVTETSSDATSTHISGGAKPHLSNAQSTSSAAAAAAAAAAAKRETRTAQLNLLLDTIQRLFSRLSTADVDTLAKRLQRQKLAGDVGHLARTTVNGILRDVDGLRDHFRRAMDSEARGRESAADSASIHSRTSGKSGGNASATQSTESESLVARKEFFALIKVFKDLFLEMARLRNAINEVSMQPQNAARILQEQLGVQVSEDKGVGAWFGRLLSSTTGTGAGGSASNLPGGLAPGSGGSGGSTPGGSSSAAAASIAALGLGSGSGHRPSTSSRTPSSSQMNATRAAAAAVPSAVAVEVKGMHASEQQSINVPGSGEEGSSRGASPLLDFGPSSFDSGGNVPQHARPQQTRRQPSLSRTQSRNLSGLFVGSMMGGAPAIGAQDSDLPRSRMASDMSANSRLSRIVDDDELSIHQGILQRARTLRPRNLSDSSMHTTFLEDETDGESMGDARRNARRSGAGSSAAGGLLGVSGPTPAAISRVITPSTLSLHASNDGTRASSASSTSGTGLFGKAFGLLSTPSVAGSSISATPSAAGSSVAPTNASESGNGVAPLLRHKTSKAQLSLASATATAALDKQR